MPAGVTPTAHRQRAAARYTTGHDTRITFNNDPRAFVLRPVASLNTLELRRHHVKTYPSCRCGGVGA